MTYLTRFSSTICGRSSTYSDVFIQKSEVIEKERMRKHKEEDDRNR